jgi:hypothetical protein
MRNFGRNGLNLSALLTPVETDWGRNFSNTGRNFFVIGL